MGDSIPTTGIAATQHVMELRPEQVQALLILHVGLLIVCAIYAITLTFLMLRARRNKGFWLGIVNDAAVVLMMSPLLAVPRGTYGRLMLHAVAMFGVVVLALAFGLPACIRDRRDSQSNKTLATLGIFLNLIVFPLGNISMTLFAQVSGFWLEE